MTDSAENHLGVHHESDNTVKDYSKLEGKHILVCEDNAINMQIAKALLHEKGIAAEPAANGEIGFQTYSFAEPFTYDMILTDIRMKTSATSLR